MLTNNSSLFTKTYVESCLKTFKKETKDSLEISQLSVFFALCKSCKVSDATFVLLIEHYDLCLILAQNNNLTRTQIQALFDCQAVRNQIIFGLDKFFYYLAKNTNGMKMIDWLKEKKQEVDITVELAAKQHII